MDGRIAISAQYPMLDFHKISVGVLQSRSDYINDCVQSVANQLYPNQFIDLVLVNNLDKSLSIGAGYNLIAKKAKADWILFLGDDDMIAQTYLFNLNAFLFFLKKRYPSYVLTAIVTHLILFNSERKIGIDVIPTGMWNKDFLLANPFNEKLKRYVDTDLFARVKNMSGVTIARDDTNHGYYYRQHENNVSKNKFTSKTAIIKEIEKKQNRNLNYAG